GPSQRLSGHQAASSANASQYSDHICDVGIRSMKRGSALPPPNSRRHDTDTSVLNNRISISTVTVASPQATARPPCLRYPSCKLNVSATEIMAMTVSSPWMRTYPASSTEPGFGAFSSQWKYIPAFTSTPPEATPRSIQMAAPNSSAASISSTP